MPKNRNILHLHFIIFIGALVPIIFRQFDENHFAIEVMLYRTFFATLMLAAYLKYYRIKFAITRNNFFRTFISGVITAFFWIIGFKASIIGGATIYLVGMATMPLWVSILRPFFIKGKIQYHQVLTGLTAIFGIYVIKNSGITPDLRSGLYLAILAAIIGAMLTLYNKTLSDSMHHLQITFYQMMGAFLGCGVVLSGSWVFTHYTPYLVFSTKDFGLIALLAFVYSIYAYSAIIKLLKYIQPFVVTITSNLSPIYGTIVALLIETKTESQGIYFYSGAIIIVSSVFAYPLVEWFFKYSDQKRMQTVSQSANITEGD